MLGTLAGCGMIDVAEEQSVQAFFNDCPSFHHLVFTAGDWARRNATPGREFDMNSAKAAFDVRFWGMLRTIDAALPRLETTGSITLTGGLLAHRPQKGQAISSAVTGAVEHVAKALALDLAPIRVNVVVPGFVATDVWAGMPAEAIQGLVDGQPLARAGNPEEVAEAYLGLMRSTYTTGQSIIVDGGMSLA